jgi:hypothetical protein
MPFVPAELRQRFIEEEHPILVLRREMEMVVPFASEQTRARAAASYLSSLFFLLQEFFSSPS